MRIRNLLFAGTVAMLLSLFGGASALANPVDGGGDYHGIGVTEVEAAAAGGQTTNAIAFNASAATVDTELEALASIGAGNVSVTGSAGGPYTVEFTGTLAGTDVQRLKAIDNLTPNVNDYDAQVTVATTQEGHSGTNETQVVTLAGATGGDFTLTSYVGSASPGQMFMCRGELNFDDTANTTDSSVMCYIDSQSFIINQPAYGARPPHDCTNSGLLACGDGFLGISPPSWTDATQKDYVAVEEGEGHLTGHYNNKGTGAVTDDDITFQGSFGGITNGIGPNVWVQATIPYAPGSQPVLNGKVSIWLFQATTADADGAGEAAAPGTGAFFNQVPLTLSETTTATAANQETNDMGNGSLKDSDKDGCNDAREVRPDPADAENGGFGQGQSTGAQRDPFSPYDFMDQYTGSPLKRDEIIAVGDIGAVVGRFGAIGAGNAKYGDPSVTPALASGYHTAADRNGSYANTSPITAGNNTWNLKPPDGNISVGDIGAVVNQFGHSCTA